MAKVICTVCGATVLVDERTRHLKTHGIEADYKGAVKRYFTTPEEYQPNCKNCPYRLYITQ